MSAHHHDDHHSAESKPVSFTVPFILACVTLLIVVSFLSLCDPKKGHHGKHECKEECAKGCTEAGEQDHHHNKAAEATEKQAAESDEDPAPNEDVPVMSSETTEKTAEPATEEKH